VTDRRPPARAGIHPLPTTDGRQPARVGDGLDRLLHQLGGPTADTVTALFSHWSEIVGEQIADHSRPVSLSGTTLVVAVDDPAWGSQLRWMESDLSERLTASLGEPVTAIEVRVRPG
jgi:predicted nucleic acid-binding Zn ribbon protein